MISRSRRRRICGAVLVWAALVLAIAAAHKGGDVARATGVLPLTVAAATPTPDPCVVLGLPVLCTPSPPPASPTAKPAPTPTAAPTPPPPPPTDPPPFFNPNTPPPATAPPATPTPAAPSAPADLRVQALSLVATGGDTVATGANVLVQATCTAKNGSDVYAVPHAKVAFQLTAPAGSTAAVSPAQGDSGDTGIATVSVDVGKVGGDVVLTATSGTTTGTLTIHVTSDPPTPTAAATPASALPGTVRIVDSGGTTGGRAVAVAGLVGFGVAILVTTLVRIGLFPRLAAGARRRRRRASRGRGPGGHVADSGKQPV